LISIRKSATELERLDHLRLTAVECYQYAIRSIAQYAVEVEPNDASDFREHLERIEESWAAVSGSNEMRSVHSSLRGELRDYRDRARERLTRLRSELEGAAAAMAAFSDSITSAGADHRETMNAELQRLDAASRSNYIDKIRDAIQSAVAGISTSLERMIRAHQMTVTQLRDEIRVLHREMQAERRAIETDASSGAWNSQKMDARLNELLRSNQSFCLLLIAIGNLERIRQRYSPAILEGALKAMLKRFHALAGGDATIGRWTDDQFLAALDLAPSAVLPISREVARKLSGSYAVQANGQSTSVVLQVTTGVLERTPGADPGAFLKKVDQLAVALGGVK
jgi:GGDEF domain-containing protein